MDDKEQAERDVQFQRRQGHRNSYTMQMEWGEWQICTEQDARRIDGLHSWQWRRIETVAASSSHREAEVKALREALQSTTDMLASACHFVSKDNGLERMLAVVDAARAALKEQQA